ncbi:hypothetical protein NMG60_11031251 [Bertholletia excelsa]
MDNNEGKCPLFPANYVTLVQLEERWQKEQERKQREKEEEEERKRREIEEQERKREAEENQKRLNENGDRSKRRTAPRQPFRGGRGRRDRPKKSSTVEASERKPEGSQIGTILVVDGGEGKIEDSSKRNKRNGRKKTKPRAKEDQAGGGENLLPESEAEKKVELVVVTEGNVENDVTAREFGRNGNNFAMNRRAGGKNVPVDGSAEIGGKFKNLSLSGGRGDHGRLFGKMHSGRGTYNRDRRFSRPKLQHQRDSNFVWVKKENTSVANDARSSGVALIAREGQMKSLKTNPSESSGSLRQDAF